MTAPARPMGIAVVNGPSQWDVLNPYGKKRKLSDPVIAINVETGEIVELIIEGINYGLQ